MFALAIPDDNLYYNNILFFATMIGKLRGIIDSLSDDRCIIDVGGVGYLVFLSSKTADNLQAAKAAKTPISLIIETVVKEDAIDLYGFFDEIEKIWFSEVTKVQGVGAKMGMKILGFFTINELAQALIAGDVKAFSKISGIGPKLAQRIATELRDSPKKLGIATGFDVDFEQNTQGNLSEFSSSRIVEDALSALENLGYKKVDALKIVGNIVKKNPTITLENLITSSLRDLSKRL